MDELEGLRKSIDRADRKLLEALARRMEIVERILQRKEASGLPLFDEQREGALVAKVVEMAVNSGVDPRLAEQVLGAVIRHSREVQAKRVQDRHNPGMRRVARVGYQGTRGAYSWMACRKYFGEQVEAIGFASFPEAVMAVQQEEVDLALLPIENVLAGSIYEVYDLLAAAHLHVVGEEILKIEHCLIGHSGTPLEQIRSVWSHPVALQQCTTFLKGLRQARVQPFIDSAEAVRKVKEDGDPTQAAIASSEAASLYDLVVLREGIEDHHENYTRFWVISRRPVVVDSRIPSKTSVLLVTEHREGALVSCLSALAAQGVNLTKLESRPRRGMPWQYQFHLDMEGNLAEDRVVRALDDVRSKARVLRVLGCYPKADAANRPPVPIPSTRRNDDPQEENTRLSSLQRRPGRTVVWAGETTIGDGRLVCIASPERADALNDLNDLTARLHAARVSLIRFTSVIESDGATLDHETLLAAARKHGMGVVFPVSRPQHLNQIGSKADVVEIGGSSMQNFALLVEAGKSSKPVMLVRGMSSTVAELLAAAEVILQEGNQQVILCEQGIRTFESSQRSTLDLGAIPLLRRQTHLPVIVDPSRAASDPDALMALLRAAHAVQADGVVVPARSQSGFQEGGSASITVDELRQWLQSLDNLNSKDQRDD